MSLRIPGRGSQLNAFNSMCIPLVTFSYIGIELLTVAAFEARDPHELKQPARNIAWFTALLYCISTGLIIANVSWQDQNLPGLFQQALTTISTGNKDLMAFGDDEPNTNAAPLIALHRLGFRFLPSFLNGCFIYSALSCANTALYVASRQLYGLTRSITVTSESNTLRRLLAWMSGVEYRTRSPWPALIVSVVTLYWLPFIRLHHDSTFLEKVSRLAIASRQSSERCRSKVSSSTLVRFQRSSYGVRSASLTPCSSIGECFDRFPAGYC